MLLKDKRVLFDLEGGNTNADKPGQGVIIFVPGEGLFILSLSPMRGAIQAEASVNRVSFDEGGHSYSFLTGSPITRSGKIWVLRVADFKPPSGPVADHGFISSGDVNLFAPGALISAEAAKN
jgi:hypothetical protein